LDGASDGEGNFVGDLTLHYETSGGRVTNWTVQETFFNPVTNRNETSAIEKEGALGLFEGNTEFTSEVYEKIDYLFRNN